MKYKNLQKERNTKEIKNNQKLFKCFTNKNMLMFFVMLFLYGTTIAGEETKEKEKKCRQLHYRAKYEKVLRASVDLDQWSYLAFPSVLQIDPSTVLISYKRGEAHGGDPGAKLEMMRYDALNEKEIETKIIGEIDELIFQMGEWVKFPNGDIANYVDMQKIVPTPNYRSNHRIGIYFNRSTDGGKSFSPMQKMDTIDGIEYGYVFEDVIVGSQVYMLVMTFPELVGKIGEEGWKRGKVHVIKSGDNGASWKFVRDLSKEFGDIDINESSFLRYGDGFIVTTRGYDGQQRLHLTNDNFEVIEQVNLTEKYSCIQSIIGRPRLFERDGAIYLLGRDYTEPFSLNLYKVDPKLLHVQSYIVLDSRPGDAYYAEVFFIEKKGKTYFNTITYVKSVSSLPDIVRLEFPWDEISGISAN
ncbi:sialidase family protein [Mariniphaga sediminis]|uniref:sialidase family protein n=1 Tax=Mariniphaga sediminis TaxID=1628158 RepID=UPI00356A4B59